MVFVDLSGSFNLLLSWLHSNRSMAHPPGELPQQLLTIETNLLTHSVLSSCHRECAVAFIIYRAVFSNLDTELLNSLVREGEGKPNPQLDG